MDSVPQPIQLLYIHVQSVTSVKVREILDDMGIGDDRRNIIQGHSNLIHELIKSKTEKPDEEKKLILYMLIDAGADVNWKDADNESPLFLAMKFGNAALCDVLLQCGADQLQLYRNKTLYQWATLPANGYTKNNLWLKNADHLKPVFSKYGMGLWKCVELGHENGVWGTLNLWCRLDLIRDGKSVMDLAVERNRDYIRDCWLNSGYAYLKLVHHVLAQDVAMIQQWYDNKPTTLGAFPYFTQSRTVPLLYYAIQYQNIKIIELLTSNGDRISSKICDDEDGDKPVLFRSLESDISPKVVAVLLENLKEDEKLEQFFWLDKSLLHVAVMNRCSAHVIRLLLEKGGPILLCMRDSKNQTAWDLARNLNYEEHTHTMEDVVTRWIVSQAEGLNQQCSILALYSFDMKAILDKCLNTSKHVQQYVDEYYSLQDQLRKLYEAIMNNDNDGVERFLHFQSPIIGSHNLALESRLSGEGLPLLHMAVLKNSSDIVRLMLNGKLGKKNSININSIRDQYRRTALHYAYASMNCEEIVELLFTAGCSEAVFDMHGRRPDDYKEMKGSPEMEHLLSCLSIQDYSSPLIDPLDPVIVTRHRNRQRKQRIASYAAGQSTFLPCTTGLAPKCSNHCQHPVRELCKQKTHAWRFWCSVL